MKNCILSLKYAINGIKLVLKEPNALIHLTIAILAIILGFVFKISTTEWLAVILCIGLVFAAETINTSIEYLVDLISPDYNKDAGEIKDIAAGAVLLCAIISVVVGCIVFIPKILKWLGYI